MDYWRQEIDPGVFSGLMPEGAKMYVRPSLPKIKYKKDGVTYEIPDLRLIRQDAVQAVELVINDMANEPDAGKSTLEAGDSYTVNDINAIIDVVTGFNFNAKKGGRNGWYLGAALVDSAAYEETGSGWEIEFGFDRRKAQAMHVYCELHPGEIKIADLIVAVVEAVLQSPD